MSEIVSNVVVLPLQLQIKKYKYVEQIGPKVKINWGMFVEISFKKVKSVN